MTTRSLENPYDPDVSLMHSHEHASDESGHVCGPGCQHHSHIDGQDVPLETVSYHRSSEPHMDSEAMIDRAVESAVVRAVFNHSEIDRRRFLKLIGGGTFAAALASIFPMDSLKAAVKDSLGPLEKKKLRVGFVPITCATPIIMAHPMGFYERYGLDVEVVKTAGWAVARDMSLNRQYDASHLLSPMPLAMSLGLGSTAQGFVIPAIENINGQAITLHVKHKDKRDPRQWKGFRFGVPFEFSMHNFLLRYYVAEHGLDPDQDIQIRVVPPPEMVANLRAENLDGYLAPDPFNQRAVWDQIGFIHMLTRDLWEGHPCCAFSCSREFAQTMPNTYGALFRAIVEATQYASNPANRLEIAEAISPAAYLNQPVPVVQQVLTGRFADGLGNIVESPDRIDFDPFPWHSMAVWILTQMKRWGYLQRDIDYHGVAEQVFLATECGDVMKELGFEPPEKSYKNFTVMGKLFDYADPEGYLNSFAIRRT